MVSQTVVDPESDGQDDDDRQRAGESRKEGFGEVTRFQQAEVGMTAAAAEAAALVQARFVMALKKPRDMVKVRERLKLECGRPGFAEVARYQKPVGGNKTADGFSIRFAETFMRYFGNILVSTSLIHEDDEKRVLRVSITDLEAPNYIEDEITIKKVVQRKKPREGERVLYWRQNTRGERVAVIEADDDQTVNKQNAEKSKSIRNSLLRLAPGDLLDECEAWIMATLKGKVLKNPDAERNLMLDRFLNTHGVRSNDIEGYLGHPLSAITPDEIIELNKLGVAIAGGETSWLSALEQKLGARGVNVSGAAQPRAETSLDDVVSDLDKKEAAAGPATSPQEAAATGRPPAAAPPPSAPAAASTGSRDGGARARLMEALERNEAQLTPDAIEAGYAAAGVSPSIEDYGALSLEQLANLNTELAGRIGAKPAPAPAPAAKPVAVAAPAAAVADPARMTEVERLKLLSQFRTTTPEEWKNAAQRAGAENGRGAASSKWTKDQQIAVLNDLLSKKT